nr:hypothetical protein [Tanacetum cinerariifolium]
MKERANWDLGTGSHGVLGDVLGTVQVDAGVRERALKILIRCVTLVIRVPFDRPMRLRERASWDWDNGTWGGRGKGFGTIQVGADLNIHSDDHVQDLISAYQDMNKDSNIYCEGYVKEQNSPFQEMGKESNIHSHNTVEQQNSPNMCKELVLAEFDAIKETIDIIDKRKKEVSTSCLEKELDIVKDRIAVLEKCFKLRYHDTSEDPVKQVCYKQHDFHYSKMIVQYQMFSIKKLHPKKRDEPVKLQ